MLSHRGCAWLMLMPLLLSLSTGELGFYRDALPETSEDLALAKYLARYLKAQRLQHLQYLLPSHLPASSFRSMHKKHNGVSQMEEADQQRRQKQHELLEVLKKSTLDSLRSRERQKLRTWPHRHYHHQYNPIDEIISSGGEDHFVNYYGVKVGYPEMKPSASEDDGQVYGDVLGQYGRVFADGEEEPILNFRGKWMEGDHAIVLHEGGGGGHRSTGAPAQPAIDEAMVTYRFDKPNLDDRHPFAVRPNDPRYYSDAPFSLDESYGRDGAPDPNEEEALDEDEEGRVSTKHEDNVREPSRQTSKDLLIAVDTLKEQESSAARHPLMTPVNQDLNSDIYFIAVVAGCSAAAMFALVLISLTWCRLQRGAKAAADIEYPAYGVTGPNKDVSPSGDQRLAQSAQMYHFQHQKQQIIAMENRTSATRDPGSLSEAESDEENEEGDYTVYECPGLASTGEMEVKNPMFHDDPTPATPAHSNNKEEDHI
ncbi:PREDICTED: uncharacterized protein LOC106750342 [Dinoponera quadriceps]|uniref:Uncharacterized protein LOC106750342 n=1 Tax=Dinoponera quadriceps TaxID=609295 RepID=A0A6P3Y726_DINQU|nr:PREDICTED: uncharacterized protein LOC106750342 [Dinoponera quadriceps]